MILRSHLSMQPHNQRLSEERQSQALAQDASYIPLHILNGY